MFPQSLNRIQLWTVRRLKQQNHILWNHQILAGVKSSVIDLKQVGSVWVRLGKFIQESLKAHNIGMGELQEKGCSRCRFNCAIKPKRFEQPLPCPNRFDPTGSDRAPHQGFESKATLILCKIANGSLAKFRTSGSYLEDAGGL